MIGDYNILNMLNPIVMRQSGENDPISMIMSLAGASGPTGLIAAAVPGIMKGIGSLFGGGARRREEKRARAQYEDAMGAYKDFKFENAFANLENPYESVENTLEDMRVATQAAEFQSQQQQAGLAQTLESLRGAGGGTGAAAIAQALAQSQAAGQQQIAANIEQQEVMNERMAAQAGMQIGMARAGGAMQTQMAEARGAMDVQGQEFGRTETLFGMSQQRFAAATEARAQATQAFGEGLGAFGAAYAGDSGFRGSVNQGAKWGLNKLGIGRGWGETQLRQKGPAVEYDPNAARLPGDY